MNNGFSIDSLAEIHVCNSVITRVSDNFLEITGFNKNEIINRNTKDVEELLRTSFLSKNIKNGELLDEFIFTKNLMPRHVKIGMYLYADKETKVYYLNKLSDFIFEKKFPAAEGILNNNVSGVAVYYIPDMKILRANEKYISFGLTGDVELSEFIGKPIFDVDKSWSDSEVYCLIKTVINTKKQIYKDHICNNGNGKHGKYYSVTLIPVSVEDHVKFIIAIYENTSDYEREKELADLAVEANLRNKENSDRLIRSINIPSITVSYPELEIISYDFKNIHADYDKQATEHYINIDRNKFLSDICSKTFLGAENRKYILEMEQTKETVETEVIEIALGGKKHLFSLIYQPRVDCMNNINQFVVFLINENTKCEKSGRCDNVQINQAEFFAYIAHELKSPLTVIHSAIQLIDFFCHDELSDRAERFIGKIRQSSLQQLRLVNNFLDLTKLDSGYFKLNKKNYDIVFMTKVIVNSVLLICENKGVKLEFISSTPMKLVLLDDEKYERILLNILSNAIKFTPAGKKITVELTVENDFVNIKVKDEGVGIPEDKKDLIFEKFGQVGNGLTRSGEGTGIGLCLAKMLAKAHNGDILLQSEVGKGSEFTILIPNVAGNAIEEVNQVMLNNEERLIQSVNVEFSNIYS